MSYKNIHFIINPHSGKKLGLKIGEYIPKVFSNKNYTIKYTQYPFHAIELVQESIEQKADLIVSCGGDGTLSEVARNLINTHITLGIIPIGSGNGLARHLKISLDYKQALKKLLHLEPKTIDVGVINDTYYFYSNLGLGFDAAVISYFSKQNLRGLIGYIKSTLAVLLSYKPIKIKLGETIQETFLLNIANSNQLGYNFTFSPKAQLDDGLLDLCWIPKLNIVQLLLFYFYFNSNKLEKQKNTTILKNASFEIECLTDIEGIQIDGEFIRIKDNLLKINTIKKAMKILA